MSLNQVKLTLQKPVKIWDQRNLDVKSEMLLNQVKLTLQKPEKNLGPKKPGC